MVCCEIVDQDIRPDWFVAEIDGERMKKAVSEWAEKHIFIGKKGLKLSNGVYYVKDCEVDANGSSTVEASSIESYENSNVIAFDNSFVKSYGNSTVRAYDHSTVIACGSSLIQACDKSLVEAFCHSTIRALGDSIVRAYSYSRIESYELSTIVIPKSSVYSNVEVTVKGDGMLVNHENKSVTCCSEWKLNKAGGNTK